MSCMTTSIVRLNMTLEFSSNSGGESASTLSRRLAGQVLASDLMVLFGKGYATILPRCSANEISCDIKFPYQTTSNIEENSTVQVERKMYTSFAGTSQPPMQSHQTSYAVGFLITGIVIGVITSAVTLVLIYGVIKYVLIDLFYKLLFRLINRVEFQTYLLHSFMCG